MTPPIDPELLLRENAWLRRLARSLVADPESADDLVQDTWVAALEHPPPSFGEGARAWLVSVARNLVRAGGRRRANESARERSAARREALPSVGESVERVAAQRELVDAVLALEPLERDLVVLRYFEDLPPRAIASRLGLSGPAVRSRLSRALARLRERLDRRFEGGRRAWAALLVPAGVRAPRPATGTPAIPLVLGALGTGAVALVVTLRALQPASESAANDRIARTESEPAPAIVETETPAQQPLPTPPNGAQRVALDGTPSGSSAPLVASTWTIVVRFVDQDHRPLAGVRLAHSDRGDAWSGESDASGTVRIELPWPYQGLVGGGQIWLGASGRSLATRGWYLTLRGPGERPVEEITMVLGGSMTGRVVDEAGAPIAGASVIATGGYTPESEAGLEEARTFASNVRNLGPSSLVQAQTSADGRFELTGVPVTSVSAHATAPGRLGGFGPLTPVGAGETVDVGDVVVALPGPENLVTGIVLDAAGQPVPGLHIPFDEVDPSRSNSPHYGRSDGDGRFSLMVPRDRRYTLRFSRDERGHDPLILADIASGTRDLEARFVAERWIEVVATAPAIGGGEPELVPIEGLQVWDANGSGLNPTTEARPDGSQRLRMPSVPFKVYVVTDRRRSQRQGPFDPATVPDRLVFQLERMAGMSGRVLADGVPVAGARVDAHEQYEAGICGLSDDGFHARIQYLFAYTETDAEGRFRIPRDSSGTIMLHAELAGWARAELGPFEFVNGVEREGLDLVLERGGTIEGRVLFADGVQAGGKVVGVSRGDAHVSCEELGADGTYRFEHLRPGDYQVLSANPRYIRPRQHLLYNEVAAADPVSWSTSVRAGEVARFDLDQRDRIPSRLSGELRFDGQPAPSWTCGLGNGRGDGAREMLASGRFDLRVACPGPFSLDFRGSAGPAEVRLTQALELAPGDNSWGRDLPTSSLTLRNLPAFERTEQDGQTPPPYFLRWRDDPALTWSAELYESHAAGADLTIPLVPAGHVRIHSRPDDLEYGWIDDSWPAVLELDLVAGSHATVALP